jgi:hypothetical protein
LVWIAPAAAAVGVAAARRAAPASTSLVSKGVAGATLTLLLSTSCVCGWYFVRNSLHLHVPFLTHSTVAGRQWWQYPGYRTPAQFISFGRALNCPVYGDLTGYLDDMYSTLWSDGMLNSLPDFAHRPPWNYGLMASGVWLSFGPMVALLAGILRVCAGRFTGPRRAGLLLCLGCVGLFAISSIYVWLTWPIYSSVKASYLLSTTPCLAVLMAAGFSWLPPNRFLRAAATGWLLCWAICSYGTYFILS